MIRVELSEPIKGHKGAIAFIELREPRYRDYMDLGLPVTWVSMGDGGYEQETPQLVDAWIERLADIDPNFLELLPLVDAMALRDAVMDFFREARRTLATGRKTTSPESSQSAAPSSSGLGSTLGPSTI